MHEYAVVSEVIGAVAQTLPKDGSVRVREVRFRHGSAMAPDVLKQAFEQYTQGTALEGAVLTVEKIAPTLTCGCGNIQKVTADEVVGHLWVCPRCGGVLAVNDHYDLELLGLEIEATR